MVGAPFGPVARAPQVPPGHRAAVEGSPPPRRVRGEVIAAGPSDLSAAVPPRRRVVSAWTRSVGLGASLPMVVGVVPAVPTRRRAEVRAQAVAAMRIGTRRRSRSSAVSSWEGWRRRRRAGSSDAVLRRGAPVPGPSRTVRRRSGGSPNDGHRGSRRRPLGRHRPVGVLRRRLPGGTSLSSHLSRFS